MPNSPAATSPQSKTNPPERPSSPATEGRPLTGLDSAVLKDVSVLLNAKLGEATVTIEELMALRSGHILKLDAALNDLVELQLNQSMIARGELVAVGDHFGVRIVEIARAP